ncbi:carbon-nitrogen hydrolase family protein [Brevibacillus fluminis]|uniref:Carbon-nitrogen hydrolase family protein n=1 Tax=Brevibacillus fluminis TaxID=511487 RepID=A0A3M8CYU8_9BACL|nr:carbon-nitrogen hydrolase family protein [Brevibacillus fluminis]RNB81032.1 carbon-nitrogen hydrolase family protein [Brevibacillus fluminis]
MRIINIALGQLGCSHLGMEDTIRQIAEAVEQVGQKKADYLLFPELYLEQEPDQTSLEMIAATAQKHRVGVVLGYCETEQDTRYNTALFIGKNGEILGQYRKIHLLDFERNVFTPGDQCPVFDLPEGKIGLMISYDLMFPEVSRILAIKGAQLLLVLAANKFPPHPHQHVYLSSRALENHVFVAMANKVGLDGNHLYLGESTVVHPNGSTIYKCSNNVELPVISINLDEIEEARGRLDYLKNRRPAVYAKEGFGFTPTESL